MDRASTGWFFAWGAKRWRSDNASASFGLAMEAFRDIAASGEPRRLASGKVLLAATLFAHEPATFGEHGSAGLYDHGGPLAASMSTISPG
jgi:hypothetical protein